MRFSVLDRTGQFIRTTSTSIFLENRGETDQVQLIVDNTTQPYLDGEPGQATWLDPAKASQTPLQPALWDS